MSTLIHNKIHFFLFIYRKKIVRSYVIRILCNKCLRLLEKQFITVFFFKEQFYKYSTCDLSVCHYLQILWWI